jgi:hypothetical protein
LVHLGERIRRLLTSANNWRSASHRLSPSKKPTVNPLAAEEKLIAAAIESVLHPESRIMVLGDFCSGKSLLLNLIMGSDVLSVSAKKATATLTTVQYAPSPRLTGVKNPNSLSSTTQVLGAAQASRWSVQSQDEEEIKLTGTLAESLKVETDGDGGRNCKWTRLRLQAPIDVLKVNILDTNDPQRSLCEFIDVCVLFVFETGWSRHNGLTGVK